MQDICRLLKRFGNPVRETLLPRQCLRTTSLIVISLLSIGESKNRIKCEIRQKRSERQDSTG